MILVSIRQAICTKQNTQIFGGPRGSSPWRVQGGALVGYGAKPYISSVYHTRPQMTLFPCSTNAVVTAFFLCDLCGKKIGHHAKGRCGLWPRAVYSIEGVTLLVPSPFSGSWLLPSDWIVRILRKAVSEPGFVVPRRKPVFPVRCQADFAPEVAAGGRFWNAVFYFRAHVPEK